MFIFFFFFFFQAEDGIRDVAVTGVQTCALPIFFSVIGGHGGAILFYIPILLLGFFPWGGVLPSALVEALREREGPPGALPSPGAGWGLGGFIFFTPSSTRLPPSFRPLVPAPPPLVPAPW